MLILYLLTLATAAFPAVSSSPDRIIGGSKVPLGGAPHQVSVRFSGSHICGGSILQPTFILTSASCATAGPLRYYSIRAGLNTLSTPEAGFQQSDVANITIHDKFDQLTLFNDIAILELYEPLDLNPGNRTSSITLPTAVNSSVAAGNVSLTGWGATRQSGEYSNSLQLVQVPLIPRENCTAAYGSLFQPNMICAGEVRGGEGHCSGDEGGPVMFNKTSTTQYQIGIVSFASGCARQGLPGVYTEVSKYLTWITNVTNAGY